MAAKFTNSLSKMVDILSLIVGNRTARHHQHVQALNLDLGQKNY